MDSEKITQFNNLDDNERLLLNNNMQIELARRFCGSDEQKGFEWIEGNSKKFREIIKLYKESRGVDIIYLYKEKPEEAIKLVELKLGEDADEEIEEAV